MTLRKMPHDPKRPTVPSDAPHVAIMLAGLVVILVMMIQNVAPVTIVIAAIAYFTVTVMLAWHYNKVLVPRYRDRMHDYHQNRRDR